MSGQLKKSPEPTIMWPLRNTTQLCRLLWMRQQA